MLSNLPRKSDINVYGTLEEIDAVRDFYGKTREEIYQVLLTDYECLQEELAFMGSVAFTYYAPAWERLFEAFYHSQACRKYYTERYMLPALEKEQERCAKLHTLLYPAS